MSDAATKREARRRRILENSENRFQKITGRISENPVEEKVTATSPSVPKAEENGLSSENITRELINSLSEGVRFAANESQGTQEHDSLSAYQRRFLFGQDLRSNFDINRFNERLSSTTQGDFNSFNADVDNLSQTSSFSKSSHIYSLLLSDLAYVFLALAVNILYLLNLDHLFGKTLVAPYIAMVVARLFLHESWQEPHDSKMLIAALILCNINPKLVHKFTRIVAIFRKIIRGFALYVFSFVIIRWILSQFWIDLQIMPYTNLLSEGQFNQEV